MVNKSYVVEAHTIGQLGPSLYTGNFREACKLAKALRASDYDSVTIEKDGERLIWWRRDGSTWYSANV